MRSSPNLQRILLSTSVAALLSVSSGARALDLVNNGTTSFIYVDAAVLNIDNVVNNGTVGNVAGTPGIEIDGGTISGDIVNNGLVSVSDATAAATGVRVFGSALGDAATIGGDIINDGTIVANGVTVAHGVLIEGDDINFAGDILNSGSIGAIAVNDVLDFDYTSGAAVSATAAATAAASAYGVRINAPSQSFGGLLNDGNITAGVLASVDVSAEAYGTSADANATGTAESTAVGIAIVADTLGGDVENTGSISASSTASVDAWAYASALNTAYASADASASAEAYGIAIQVNELNGSVLNSGTISADARAVIESDARAYGSVATAYAYGNSAAAEAVGIKVNVNGTFNGDFDNSGGVTAYAEAISDNNAVAAGGDAYAYAAGEATATAVGIQMSITSDMDGDFLNSGALEVRAIADVGAYATAMASVLDADAYAYATSADAYATGMKLQISELGTFDNSGAINADATANAFAYAEAQGRTSAYAYASASAYAEAIGIEYSGVNIEDDFLNSGEIVANALAEATAVAYAVAVTGSATADARAQYASAEASGIYVSVNSIAGNVENSGNITADAEAVGEARASAVTLGSGLYNAEADAYASAYAYATGIYASIGTLDGDFNNSGDVAANAVASASANAYANAAAFSADAYARMDSASAYATGIYASIATLGGNFINSGAVSADAVARGSAEAQAIGIEADATAYATSAEAYAQGIYLSISQLDGDFDNSGDLDVSALAEAIADARATAVDSAYAYASASAYASATGIEINANTIGGDILNSGTVQVDVTALASAKAFATASGGDATAYAYASSAQVDGYGIYVYADTLGGSFNNSGDVTINGEAISRGDARAFGTDDAYAYATGDADVDVTGIYVYINTTASGDFLNSGAVLADARALVDVNALAVATSDTASAYAYGDSADAEATGIYIGGSALGGDFDNSGDVTARALATSLAFAQAQGGYSATASATGDAEAYARGIYLGLSTIGGDIINSAAIVAQANAIVQTTALAMATTYAYAEVDGSADATAYGVVLSLNSVGGSFNNSGTISASAVASALNLASAAAGSTASAEADGSAEASAYGIYGSAGTMDGDFVNTGAISATAFANTRNEALAISSGDEATTYATGTASADAYGIYLWGQTIGGDFINSGNVTANAEARAVNFASATAGTADDAYAYASGDAEADVTGFYFSVNTILGAFTNSGDILATARAVTSNTALAVSVTDSATAYAYGDSASADAYGLYLQVQTIAGGFNNSGNVTAEATATSNNVARAESSYYAYAYATGDADVEVTGVYFGGNVIGATSADDLVNSGDIVASGRAFVDNSAVAIGSDYAYATVDGEADATVYGLNFSVDTVGGSVINSGNVTATATASVQGYASASATDDAYASASASASATAYGIYGTIWTIGGNLTNTGDVTVAALANVNNTVRAYSDLAEATAEISATTVYAYAYGINLRGNTLGGDFLNSGAVSATASAINNSLATAITEGADDAYAEIDATAYAYATGMFIRIDTILGDVSNTGQIDVLARALVENDARAIALFDTATAYATGTATASAHGVQFEFDTIGGDFSNSGDITADALARVTNRALASAEYYAYAYANGSAEASVDYGLYLDGGTVLGSFTNSGDVTASAIAELRNEAEANSATSSAEAYVYGGTAEADVNGLYVSLSTLGDGFTNSGNVSVFARASSIGTALANGVSGANASATAEADADASGFYVSIGSMGGDFLNSGTVDATAIARVRTDVQSVALAGSATAEAYGTSASANATGFYVRVDTLDGDMVNTGNVTATVTASSINQGIAVATSSADVHVDGSAYAYAYGADFGGSTVNGDITNNGDITASAQALASNFGRAEAPLGFARARVHGNSAYAYATGVEVSVNNTLDGNFSNTGDIFVEALATSLNVAEAVGTWGSASATGNAEAYAYGIDFYADTLTGNFLNSGDVTISAEAKAVASALASMSATANADARAYATVTATGVSISTNSVGGSIENSGTISVLALASALAVASAFGTAASATATASAAAYARGFDVFGGVIDGDVINSGSISATAIAIAEAQGSSTSMSWEAEAFGMDVRVFGTGAGIVNSGSINASAQSYDDAMAVGLAVSNGSFTGAITNTGSIIASASASSTMPVTATATGIAVTNGTTIDGGIVNTGTISAQGSLVSNAINIDGAGAAMTIALEDGDVTGDIRMVNANADTIDWSGGTLDGDIYGGGGDTINVFAGIDNEFDFEGDIDTIATINVNTTAGALNEVLLRLNGTGTNIGALNVNQNGTLVVGTAGNLTVGTFNQDADGTLAFEITPTTAGQISATTANIDGTILAKPLAGLYADNTVYTDVINSGNVIGTFATVGSTNPMLVASVDYTVTGVDLELNRIGFDQLGPILAGLSKNGAALGGGIENVYAGLDPLSDIGLAIGELFALTPEQLAEALNGISGEQTSEVPMGTLIQVNSLINLIHGQLGSGSGAQLAQIGETGMSAGDKAGEGGTTVWGRVFGSWGELKTANGFDTDSVGLIAGADHGFTPNFRAGVAGSYQRSDFDMRNGGGDISSFALTAYGSYVDGPIYVNGLMGYAFQNYEFDRNFTVGMTNYRANADYDGNSFYTGGEVGYSAKLEGGTTIQPFANLTYIHSSTDSYTETGAAPFNLSVGGISMDSLASTLGARIAHTMDMGGGAKLTPMLKLGWKHEFGDAVASTPASLALAPGSNYTITGDKVGRDRAVVGAGLGFNVTDTLEATIQYDGEFGGKLEDNALSLRLEARF